MLLMVINHLRKIELTRELQGKPIDRNELAKKLGIRTSTLSGYFTGKITPPLEKAYQIAHYLNMAIENVFEYIHEDDHEPN